MHKWVEGSNTVLAGHVWQTILEKSKNAGLGQPIQWVPLKNGVANGQVYRPVTAGGKVPT